MESHPDGTIRDHLFISYAGEDSAFARWLALRLTSEGYKVWIDQFKLLGGESYPRDIDIAIKARTFRVLALLSRHSITKPNPLKERTLALNIARSTGPTDFLIPLNVDGLSPSELDWMTSDLTFVPFTSWSQGFIQLLKLLAREDCPRADIDGRAIVRSIASANDIVVTRPDIVVSNASQFKQVPECLTTFIVDKKMHYPGAKARQRWAFYKVSPERVLAFHAPSTELADMVTIEPARSAPWRSTSRIEGITSSDVVVRLLRSAIELRCLELGLQWSPSAKALYFAGPLGENMSVQLPSGSKTVVQHSGQRTYFRVGQPKMPYRYRLAVKPVIDRDLLGAFSVVWRLGFHFTDLDDVPLPPARNLSRRKHVTRDWHNYHWLVRHLAVMQYLADDDGRIRVGPEGMNQVILDCTPVSYTTSKAIDESRLAAPEEISDEVPIDDSEETDEEDRAEEGEERASDSR